MTSSTLRTVLIAFAVAITVAIASFLIAGGKSTPVAEATTAGVQTTPKSTPTPEPVAPESLTDNTYLYENEAQFILAIEDYDGIDYTASEEGDIVAGGYVICSDLAAGYTPEDEALFLADEFGVSAYDGGVMVGVTVNYLCSEFTDEVDAAINA